jgi:hypothetical protein
LHLTERGCVADQPQRVGNCKRLDYFNEFVFGEALRLVEDDTAALLSKRKQRGSAPAMRLDKAEMQF